MRAMEIEDSGVGFARWVGLELAFGWRVVTEGRLDLTERGALPARLWLRLEVFRMRFLIFYPSQGLNCGFRI